MYFELLFKSMTSDALDNIHGTESGKYKVMRTIIFNCEGEERYLIVVLGILY